ncbi:MAG TPA: YlaI family protein [Virgibacillus sp.]|nr:YlaI family protein [Virgibacillus sp.]
MRVQCVLCDQIEQIDEYSLRAKRLRNRRIQMYLCPTCDERISVKTIQRHQTGKFRLYEDRKQKSKFL